MMMKIDLLCCAPRARWVSVRRHTLAHVGPRTLVVVQIETAEEFCSLIRRCRIIF